MGASLAVSVGNLGLGLVIAVYSVLRTSIAVVLMYDCVGHDPHVGTMVLVGVLVVTVNPLSVLTVGGMVSLVPMVLTMCCTAASFDPNWTSLDGNFNDGRAVHLVGIPVNVTVSACCGIRGPVDKLEVVCVVGVAVAATVNSGAVGNIGVPVGSTVGFL